MALGAPVWDTGIALDSAEDGIGGLWDVQRGMDINESIKERMKHPSIVFSSHPTRPKRRFLLSHCGVGPSLVGYTGSVG